MGIWTVLWYMSKSSVAGGFGDQALERIVAKDTFVQAEVRDVVISQRVEYYSGSIGRGPKHTGKLSVIQRRNEDDSRDVRIVDVDPSVFLRVYVNTLNKRLLVRMSPSEIVELGEFTSLRGSFKLTTDKVYLKVDSDTVTFENYGSYTWDEDVSDTMTYSSFRSMEGRAFDRGYQCGKEIEERLRCEWAKKKGIHSGIWRVKNVNDSEHSSSVEIEVENKDSSDRLRFSLSMDEWDENQALRDLVKKDGDGLVSNLEEEEVCVSFKEYDNAVSERDGWFLYRANGVKSLLRRLQSVFVGTRA